MKAHIGAIVVALALIVPAAEARPTSATIAGFSARVQSPPEVQRVGGVYYIRVIVRTRSRPIPRLCIDFEDDGGSWKISMGGGLRSYDDDTWCYGRLAANVPAKVFIARLIPARTGQRKLTVTVGNADIYRAANNAVLGAGSLEWSSFFVLI